MIFGSSRMLQSYLSMHCFLSGTYKYTHGGDYTYTWNIRIYTENRQFSQTFIPKGSTAPVKVFVKAECARLRR